MRENAAGFRDQVAARAGHSCEYCHIPEEASFAPHELDHVVPVKHGGETSMDNLAFSCVLCNRRKGSDLAAIDPATGQIVPLFNPRREPWHEHFQLHLLRLNHPDRVKERLISSGWLWTRD